MARACILVLPIRVVAIGVAAIGLFASCDARPRQPNVLLILADDLGWNDVGYHGSEIRTPHLDALATEGVRLESFYVQPYCSATRAALMTGRYPMRMGLQKGLIRPWEKDGLPLEERTLAEALKGAGYATAVLGKWHLGAAREAYLPLWRGFDHHYGHYNGAIDYFTHELYGGLDWHRNGIAVDEEGYATDLLADEAVRWIRRVDPGRPFFLYLAFNAPHSPLQAPDEQRDRYPEIDDPRRRTYAAMVSALDDGVGRIVAALEEDGRLDDTIVVFASDNGGHPKAAGDNTPLRGQKGNAYEGGIRVPAFVSWRGRLPAGRVTNVPIHVVDLYPTLLRLAGVSTEQTLPVDGRDVWPALAGPGDDPLDRSELLLDISLGRGAIRDGEWKLLVLNRDMPSEVSELYRLSNDPIESRNLAGQRPDVVERLRERLEVYFAQVSPDPWLPEERPADFRTPPVWSPGGLRATSSRTSPPRADR